MAALLNARIAGLQGGEEWRFWSRYSSQSSHPSRASAASSDDMSAAANKSGSGTGAASSGMAARGHKIVCTSLIVNAWPD